MSAQKSITLLRRTAVAFAAVLGMFTVAGANAATVTLVNSTGNTCTYSGGIQVNPDASISITCAGTTTPPPTGPNGGVFSISAPASCGLGTTPTATITRTGGSTGAFSFTLSTSGLCATVDGRLSAPLTMADGQVSTSQMMALAISAGSCTITISGLTQTDQQTLGTAGSIGTGSATIAVGTTPNTPPTTPTTPTTPTGPLPSGICPTGFTAPANTLQAALGGFGNPLLQMQASGQIVAIALPAPPAGVSSGVLQISESAGGAYTPSPVTLEVSINQCPGLIEATQPNQPNYCNIKSNSGTYSSVTWFAKPYGPLTSAASAAAYGYCWAGNTNGPYYINARWTYASCAFGAQICGFAIQQNQGPY